MSTHGNYEARAIVAGEDLSGDVLYRAISYGGTITGTNALGRQAGVLVSKGKSGERVSYAYEGEVKVRAGAAITTPGYAITVTGSGWFVAATSGGMAIGRYLGDAACASGDIVPAFVNFYVPGYFGGF